MTDLHPNYVSRRRFLRGATLATLSLPVAGGLLAACAGDDDELVPAARATSTPRPRRTPTTTAAHGIAAAGGTGAHAEVLTPDTALTKLMDGNKRFVAMKAKHPNATQERLVEVAKGQHPFCAILSCVDSRVPPELVFDAGLGDLFVARVAAGIADDSAVGSTEFGVEEFHIPLVMVLGHERCGAVKATVDAVAANNLTAPGSIGAVVGPIIPAVKAVKDKGGDILDNAVRESVKLSVAALKASPILSKEIA